jgi:D-sedoheptulose 7-phosphate isomerase
MKEKTLDILAHMFHRYPQLACCELSIITATQLLIDSYKNGGKLLICGNGGSASDAHHIVGELMKSFILPRPIDKKIMENIRALFPADEEFLINNLQGTLPALTLISESALITACANDINADLIFAQQVLGYAKQNDILLVISTSGNSLNVLYAIKVAKAIGIKVIGLTGDKGGQLKDLCDESIMVPANETYKIQEYHLPVYHVLCYALENEFYGE